MRLELTLAGLLFKLANHYTIRGAQEGLYAIKQRKQNPESGISVVQAYVSIIQRRIDI